MASSLRQPQHTAFDTLSRYIPHLVRLSHYFGARRIISTTYRKATPVWCRCPAGRPATKHPQYILYSIRRFKKKLHITNKNDAPFVNIVIRLVHPLRSGRCWKHAYVTIFLLEIVKSHHYHTLPFSPYKQSICMCSAMFFPSHPHPSNVIPPGRKSSIREAWSILSSQPSALTPMSSPDDHYVSSKTEPSRRRSSTWSSSTSGGEHRSKWRRLSAVFSRRRSHDSCVLEKGEEDEKIEQKQVSEGD